MKILPRVIFSGIQPTGTVHLGNFFGAIKRWVELQDSGSKSIISIVDLHSITLPQKPQDLNEGIIRMAATVLACRIDPRKTILFQQSAVKEHAEFSWILKCITTMARLGRLPQFKEKSEKLKEVPLGLFVYPVLQSADILLYKTTHVPVGEDQVQHIQLAQDLQRVFNHTFKTKVLIRPTAIVSDGPDSRVKSIRNPEKKMSKSDPEPKSWIGLTDTPDVITDKLKKALTDLTSAVTFDPDKRPAVSNLILIHSLCSGLTPEQICEQNSGIDTGKYKLVVADSVIEMLSPIQRRYSELINDRAYLLSVLKEGADEARTIASETLGEVKEAVGMVLK